MKNKMYWCKKSLLIRCIQIVRSPHYLGIQCCWTLAWPNETTTEPVIAPTGCGGLLCRVDIDPSENKTFFCPRIQSLCSAAKWNLCFVLFFPNNHLWWGVFLWLDNCLIPIPWVFFRLHTWKCFLLLPLSIAVHITVDFIELGFTRDFFFVCFQIKIIHNSPCRFCWYIQESLT